MSASNNETKFGNISYNGGTYTNGVGFEECFNIASYGNSLNFGSSGTFRFYSNSNPNKDFIENFCHWKYWYWNRFAFCKITH